MLADESYSAAARSIAGLALAMMIGLASAVSAESGGTSDDSLYRALSGQPLDSLSASQYLWLQQETERRQRLAPASLAPASRPFSSVWDRPPKVHSATDRPSLSGPRFGFTLLSDGIVEKLKDDDIDVGSAVTQFGWQFEKRFYARENGPMGVTQWVLLVGGLEQGVVLPSMSWLVGIRSAKGAEVGVGPNVTPAGAALAVAVGVTFREGALNFPVNLAVVPSRSGVRVSLLAGFNMLD